MYGGKAEKPQKSGEKPEKEKNSAENTVQTRLVFHVSCWLILDASDSGSFKGLLVQIIEKQQFPFVKNFF